MADDSTVDPQPTSRQIWPTVDAALRDAEEAAKRLGANGSGWYGHTHLQAKLLLAISKPSLGYHQLRPEDQQAVLLRVTKLVPRVAASPFPQEELEALFGLWRHPDPHAEMARAVKVQGPPFSRPLAPDEDLYLQGSGWLEAWMDWVRYSDVPLGYYWWAGLSALGAACRYNWFIDRGADMLRLNTYMLFVGDKATGKSSALTAEVDLLRRMNYLISPYKEDDPNWALDEHPWHVRLLPEDTNQETLTAKLGARDSSVLASDRPGALPVPVQVDSTGLLALDELATFLGREGWMIEKRIPWLTTMYGRSDYTYETKSGGRIPLKNIALSMIGCCTPDWMKVAISPLMFGGGFLDRTLIVSRAPLARRFYPTAMPRDPVRGNYLARHLKDLSCRLRPEELYGEPAAKDWFHQWYLEQPEPQDHHATSVKRTANHLWKIGGLLALSDGTAPRITLDQFRLAHRLLEQESTHYGAFLQYLHRPVEEDHLAFIERKLVLAGAYGRDAAGQPRSKLQSQLFHHLRQRKGLSPPNPKVLPYLESLVSMGRVELVVVDRGGRPGKGWRLTDEAVESLQEEGKLAP